MAGDAREIELGETARAPAALGETQVASVPPEPLARGTHEPAAGTDRAESFSRRTAAARITCIACTLLGAIMLVYFVARFLFSAEPPQLHPAYIGESQAGRFSSLAILDGPYLTLVRITAIAVIYLSIASWAAWQYRRAGIVQLIAATAALAGTYSMAVAVLTSSESEIIWRVLAAVIYVLMPAFALSLACLFPNGRLEPSWSIYVVPVAVSPFVIQVVNMFAHRTYSVAVAAIFFPFAALFLYFLFRRYRHKATVRERYQIKWLSYSAAWFVVIQAVAVVVIIPLLADRERPAFPFFRILFELLLASSYLVGLASILFSGARYRVWAIDRVINRTIVYVVVSLLLAAVCGVAFLGLRVLFEGALPSAIGAAVSIAIVLAFAAPTRRRISRWIDRRFYGIGLDYEALAAKAVRAAHSPLPATNSVLGAYDELVLLGRGGMGAVYRAHHPDFEVPVALKVISPQLAQDADARARFHRESQILEDLDHPNVIPFLASGHEAGLAFIAMEYIAGEDLAAVVRHRGPLPLEEVCAVMTGVATALDLAHSRGVVHRDIKPANIFVEGETTASLVDRRALVMDFGVARLADDPRAPDASLVGSLPYIAPEQIHNADEVDGRADVYSLGATAYELVTGRPPFVESTALGLVLAHLHQPPLDPRTFAADLPPFAAAAILKALAKRPADRFSTASAFAKALTYEY